MLLNVETLADTVYGYLTKGDLALAFQPIVSAHAVSHVLYHEGLVRFKQGALAFNPIAVLEHAQRIRMLDASVVAAVIELLEQHESLRLGCNISAQSAQLDLHWHYLQQRLLQKPGVARRLFIEITESASFPSTGKAVEFVSTLAGTGCRVAVDDFGVGCTTFDFIVDARPQVIKIDRSYLAAARGSQANLGVLEELVAVCRSLCTCVVLEGIETPEDRKLAQAVGADWLQGYLFGQPRLEPAWASTLKTWPM
jgi:EAL domain-containing protein (putative c-di-GMP-specific phosphodiesterase class I)